jgi:hypothetical protein
MAAIRPTRPTAPVSTTSKLNRNKGSWYICVSQGGGTKRCHQAQRVAWICPWNCNIDYLINQLSSMLLTTIFNLNEDADVLEYLGKLLEVKEHQGRRCWNPEIQKLRGKSMQIRKIPAAPASFCSSIWVQVLGAIRSCIWMAVCLLRWSDFEFEKGLGLMDSSHIQSLERTSYTP